MSRMGAVPASGVWCAGGGAKGAFGGDAGRTASAAMGDDGLGGLARRQRVLWLRITAIVLER